MHIEISAKALSSAAAVAARVAGRKMAVSPIYHHVLITASADALTLTAMDDRMSIKHRADVDRVHRPGAVCLPSDLLAALSSRIPPAATVTLVHEKDGRTATLSFGRARHQLPALGAEEFPELANDTYECQMTVAGADLHEAMTRAQPFCEKPAAYHQSMMGLHFKKADLGLELVGTSPRAACRTFVMAQGDVCPVTLPESVVGVVISALTAAGEDAQISTSTTKIRFQTGGTEIVSKIVDFPFPEMDKIDASITPAIDFVFDVDELTSALDRVRILASQVSSNDKSRAVHLTGRDGVLYVHAGECVEEVGIEGLNRNFGFSVSDENLKLMLRAVGGEGRMLISEERVGMKIESAANPAAGRVFGMGLRVYRPEISAAEEELEAEMAD